MKNVNEKLRTINEFYTKCQRQSNDINNEINEIKAGKHPISAIDKVKDKILEKLENYEESLRLVEIILNELDYSDKEIWKK